MAEPGRRIGADPGIDERRFLATKPSARRIGVGDRVDPATEPLESAKANLVAERVGEALDRYAAVDEVAVVEQPDVDRAQLERALLSQHGPHGVA